MKNILLILLVLLLVSCNCDNAPDCFQNAGDIIQKEVTVEAFTKITVFKNVELIITQGPIQRVVLETGEYLLSDVEVKVENGRLLLKDNNGCNLTREYGVTKVYVTSPNLTEIRNSTNLTVRSNGVLNYETLDLLSEDYNEDFYNVGIFDLEVNSNNLKVTFNNLSTIFISGIVTNLNIGFFSGDGRFEGRNLIADKVTIYHRGTNDIIVNPQESITANLVSTGDVIVVNTPPMVTVTEQFNGRVIFE